MNKERLTKTAVDRLKPAEAEYVIWCGKLSGFGCRVWPTGKKVFIIQFRVAGRLTKKTLGTFGTITVEQARKEAERYLAAAQLGHDLVAAERKMKTGLTVSQLCDEYIKLGMGQKKPSTIATDLGRIDAHIRPLLGKKRISSVTRSDIERFLNDVAIGRTARDIRTKKGRSIVRGGKGTATRTVRLLGGIFTYAVERGYIEKNPKSGVKLFKDNSGEKYLSDDEMQRLGKALNEAETVGLPWDTKSESNTKHRPKDEAAMYEVMSPHVTGAIRLLLLTGCRLREVLHLRWSEVDFEHGILNLPDSKTGQKKVYLSEGAIDVLQSLPRIGTFVIYGTRPDKPRADLKRPWKRVCDRAGLNGVRLHDLRHTFASNAVSNGMSLPMIGALLGHRSTSTTARYAHIAESPLKRALDEMSQPMTKAISKPSATGE